MITSSSIQYITRMLNEPKSLTDMDRESVAAIVKEFPYFVPARYMGAAIEHKKTTGNEVMANMWLYMGNWLLFNDFLTQTGKEEKKEEKAEEVAPKTREKIKFSLTTVETEPEIVVTKTPPNVEQPVFKELVLDTITPAEIIKEPVVPIVQTQNIEPALEPVQVAAAQKETIKEPEVTAIPTPVISQPIELKPEVILPFEVVETVAEQIVHHEAEVYEEEVYAEEIIQPLIIKEDLVKTELPIRAPGKEEQKPQQEETVTSLYVDDDEYEKDDDLIIKPLSYTIEHIDFNKEQITNQDGDALILPIYTDNYFFHQGIKVSDDIPEEMDHSNKPQTAQEPMTKEQYKDKSLMVMMSFSEWLLHFKTKTQKETEEIEDKRALKSMWQQEKLAAANEEENEEIPEEVFNMAVNSITREEDLASEALAQIHRKQGKYDRAIDMYRKLSLRNPQKLAYFAHKIEELLKEKEL